PLDQPSFPTRRSSDLGAGGAIRKLFLSVHHHADASAERAVCVIFLVDHRTRSQPVERAGHVFAFGHCEEEWHLAGGLHEPPARHRNASAGSYPRSQPRAVASYFNDHAFDYCRTHSRGDWHWRWLGAARVHRRYYHWRADALSAADAARRAG